MRFILILVAVSSILLSCKTGQKEKPYFSEIKEHRKEITKSFLVDASSPLEDEDRKYFVGLNYFDADPSYAVWADLKKLPSQNRFTLNTSTERVADYLHTAYLEFELNGQKHQLRAYTSPEEPDGTLFVPFGDLTNGKSSYESGRYIDLEPSDSSKVLLDFNKAYNPYCAYNKKYSCVVPPEENRLSIAIEAGEKKFH